MAARAASTSSGVPVVEEREGDGSPQAGRAAQSSRAVSTVSLREGGAPAKGLERLVETKRSSGAAQSSSNIQP